MASHDLRIFCVHAVMVLMMVVNSLSFKCSEDESLLLEGENYTFECSGQAPVGCNITMVGGASADFDLEQSDTNFKITLTDLTIDTKSGTTYVDVSCHSGDHHLVTGLLGRNPLPIKDLDCQLRNWDNLYCSWSPTEKDQKLHIGLNEYADVDVNTEVQWNSSNGKRGSLIFEPETVILNSTAFTLGDNISVEIIVQAKYRHESIHNFTQLHAKKTINTSLIVKPGPVTKLSCDSEATKTSCSWVLPSENHLMKVMISLKPTNVNWTENSTTKLHIDYLKPNTEYTLEIYTLPMQGGFESETRSRNFTTKPDVPGGHPLTSEGSFWIHNCSEENCVATVYFQPLPEDLLHHLDVKYNVTLTGHSGCQNKSLTLNHGETNVNFTVNNKCDYNLDLIAYNELGESSAESSSLHLPRKTRRLEAPQIIVRKRLDDTAVLQWDCQGDRNYTVYWCQEENKMCNTKTDRVHWRRADRTCDMSLSLPSGWKVDEMLFAVSVYANHNTSGLQWNNQLEYDDTQPPEKPVLSGDAIQATESLQLRWHQQPCHSRTCKAFVTSYNIAYCLVRDCSADANCIGPKRYRTVPGKTLEETVAVSPGIYTVVVEAVSHAGNVSSKAVCLTINEKWYRTWWFPVVIVTIGLGIVCLIAGVVTCAGYCKKAYEWFQHGVGIRLPERQTSIHDSSGISSGTTLYLS